MLVASGCMPPTQRVQQRSQAIVVKLEHQRQQPANFAFWKTFPRKPGQVIAWQISDQPAFVFAKRHLARHQQFKIFRVHVC